MKVKGRNKITRGDFERLFYPLHICRKLGRGRLHCLLRETTTWSYTHTREFYYGHISASTFQISGNHVKNCLIECHIWPKNACNTLSNQSKRICCNSIKKYLFSFVKGTLGGDYKTTGFIIVTRCFYFEFHKFFSCSNQPK